MNRIIRILLGLVIVLALGVFVAACGDDEEESGKAPAPAATATQPAGDGDISADEKAANKIAPIDGASNVRLTIGSKNFTEQFVLGEIYAQALKAAGYNVKTDLNLGDALIAYKALREREIDAYPEYTGTALTSFFDVKVADVPRDPKVAYENAKAAYAKQKITALAPTPFENTYRLGMTKAGAKKFGNPTKISDLAAQAGKMTINGYPECRQRIDCLLGVEREYGLKFERFRPSQNPYPTLDNGDADVAFVFTTDGPLASGKYVVLDDDRSVFPPYNITFAVRDETAQKLGSEGQQVITNVQKYMTEEIMQELNARVDIDKKEPAAAAREYLQNFGFIAES